MNKQIKKLWEESGNGHFPTGEQEVYVNDADLEKFAELIIRECKRALYKKFSNGEFMYIEGSYKAISEHFGIEE